MGARDESVEAGFLGFIKQLPVGIADPADFGRGAHVMAGQEIAHLAKSEARMFHLGETQLSLDILSGSLI
jgi:hypothetical protein